MESDHFVEENDLPISILTYFLSKVEFYFEIFYTIYLNHSFVKTDLL